MNRFLYLLFLVVGLMILSSGVNRFLNPYLVQILCTIGINILMAVSLNFINGQTGQFSLGHAGFMAVGAYSSAILTKLGIPILIHLFPSIASFLTPVLFIFSVFVGGGLAAIAGFIVGIPALRLTGDYLAIVTLGFGEILIIFIVTMKFLGGAIGLTDIPTFSNFFWIFLFLILALSLVWNLLSSPKGKAFLAIRENEIAAASVGINCTRYKVIAFTWSAFLAGIAGALYAHLMGSLDPTSFNFFRSIEFVVMVVLGGIGSITGAILAATLLTVMPELLRGFDQWRMVFYALLLIVMMIWRPQGIFGNREWKRFFK